MGNIDIVKIVVGMSCFILAGSIHEFSHALANYLLGDHSAKSQGRLTLNPMRHIDLVGTIMMPLLVALAGVPVFGWMKPVPFNPNNFKDVSKGAALSAFAGPLSNLIQACLALVLFRMVAIFGNSIPQIIFYIITQYYSINIALMIFNLLPTPPLDGGWILRHFLSAKGRQFFDEYQKYGQFVLLLLLWSKALYFILSPAFRIGNSLLTWVLKNQLLFSFIPLLLALSIVLFLLRKRLFDGYSKIKEREKGRKREPFESPDKTRGSIIPSKLQKKNFSSSVDQEKQKFALEVTKILKKCEGNERLVQSDLESIEKLRIKHQAFDESGCTLEDFQFKDSYCQECEDFFKCSYKKILFLTGEQKK